MGVPRRDCWCHWWSSSITLALNFISFNFVVKTATQSSSLSGIQIGFPSPRDFFLLTSLMFLSQIFPIPSSYLFSPIYIILLVGLSWWEDIPHISGSLRVISLVRGHLLLLTWPPSNSCLTLVIAWWTNSPKVLFLVHDMFGGTHLYTRPATHSLAK